MKRYFRIYKKLVRLNIAVLFAFRTTFFNNIISSTLWSVFPILTTFLLTSKSKHFYSWTTNDLYLLTAYFTFFLGLFYTLFGKSFKRFSRMSEFGQLDAILLKPVDSQFMISFWHINFTNLTRMMLGIGMLVYFSRQMHLVLTVPIIASVILFTIASIILLYSIWFSILTLTVWFSQLSNLRDLLITLNMVTRYPPEMFQNVLLFIAFLPLMTIMVTPTKILLQTASVYDLIILVSLAICSLVFSRFFWKFALRYYTSAGG